MVTKATRSAHCRRNTVLTIGALLLLLPAAALAGDLWDRFWSHIQERPEGPMSFRFLLQPTMASIAAFHDGVKDAALGRSPYFWTVVSDPAERASRLREGLNATGKILALGIGLDIVYQIVEFKRVYPLEAIVMALLLAFMPYLLLRGPVARVAQWRANRNRKVD